MTITKEQAREQLEKHIAWQAYLTFKGSKVEVRLPIKDEVVCAVKYGNEINEYTFKGLLKIAYGL